MIRRTTNLRKVFEVQKQVDEARDALTKLDARDHRAGVLLDMFTELLILRRNVEATELRIKMQRH